MYGHSNWKCYVTLRVYSYVALFDLLVPSTSMNVKIELT